MTLTKCHFANRGSRSGFPTDRQECDLDKAFQVMKKMQEIDDKEMETEREREMKKGCFKLSNYVAENLGKSYYYYCWCLLCAERRRLVANLTSCLF